MLKDKALKLEKQMAEYIEEHKVISEKEIGAYSRTLKE